MPTVWRILVVMALLSVLAAVAAVGWLLALQPVDLEGTSPGRVVQIPEGSGLRAIATLLHEQGLIRHDWAFMAQATLSGQARALQAGYYQLSPALSTTEMLESLANGATQLVRVTFPEGYDLRQIGDLLEEKEVCTAPELLGVASPELAEEVLGWPLPEKAGTAEGYLFPDTYYFRHGENPQVVAEAMLRALRDKFITPLWEPAAEARPWGGLHQVVTLASLVEKEARLDEERELIAGVLHARLRRNMRLQCDATVLYALGEHRPRLLYEDLKVDSPYNTYLYPGLPPGPICSPGLASLQAALNPPPTEYLFYVARPDGSHVFTRTYEEHLAAIRSIRGTG